MNRWIRFGGILGIIVLLFALIPTFTFGFDFAASNILVLAHFVFAGFALLAWVYYLATSGTPDASVQQRAGRAFSGRIARYGANAVLASAVFVGLLIVANWFAHRYDKRWDLTEEGVYSLAPQSKEIVSSIDRPLKLVGLTGPAVARLGQEVAELKDLFDRYREENPSKVKTVLFDPEAKVHLLDQYEFKQGNIVYLEYGEGNDKSVSRINEASEEAVTNAIIKLQRGAAKKVYYVTGHDEPSLKSGDPTGLKRLADGLTDEHVQLEELFLGDKGDVPADAAAVILVSPKKPFGAGEKDLLIKYAEQGGRLLMLHDPRMTSNVKDVAAHFGIEIGENVVLDQQRKLFQGPTIGVQPVVNTYGDHAIVKNFTEQDVTIFSMASSVTQKGKNENGITYTELIKTGPNAWAESDLNSLFQDPPQADLSDSDVKGPVTLGIVYEKKLQAEEGKAEKVSRVVVIGDSDWMINANLDVYKNRDLIMNSIQWIAGEEGGVSIRPRSIKKSLAPIGERDFMTILGASLLIPEIILIFGLAVWWRRRTVATA